MPTLTKNALTVIKKALERKTALEDKIADSDLRDEKLDDLLAELNNVLCIIEGYRSILGREE